MTLATGSVRDRAGRSARNGVGQADGAPLRNDHAMRASGERRANDGAEIVRIFDAIEKNDEAFASVTGAFICRGENAVERCRRARGRESDDSLMIFRIGQAIELAAVLKAHGNVVRAR